jgi:bifunctional non-homologous end joining protein LigD
MAKLAAYNAKRDFSKTKEPPGKAGRGRGFGYLVQKHAASRLHYDFRLELDGVLLSWAIARGPSLVPGEKRLAVHTEDHPLDYGDFEGTIPKGQYGGGTVLLWDRGTWEPEGDPVKAMAKGSLDFTLQGEKLRGRWHLVRMRPRPGEKNESWLLIKSDDEFARTSDEPDILEEAPLSVKSGRSLEEIAGGDSAVWQSNRPEKLSTKETIARIAADARQGAASTAAAPAPAPRAAVRPRKTAVKAQKPSAEAKAPLGKNRDNVKTRAAAPDARRAAPATGPSALPQDVRPCLATLVDKVPTGDRWVHEIKWDGYRLVAYVQNGDVTLRTRNGLDWTDRFPTIAAAVAKLPVQTAIIDGEGVVEDESGATSFAALQAALSDTHSGIAEGAVLYAFDLLYLDGEDLRGLPLEERKARLAAVIPPGPGGGAIRYSEHIEGEGEAMVRNACRLGLEGVISKRRDLPYRPGRGSDWLKTKCTQRQELVIAGFVPSTALKNAIGSLVLGYYRGGRLIHAGKTGTGFTADLARELWRKLNPLRRDTPAFPDKLTSEQRRGAVWVEPKLVGEVELRGWTTDGLLRHAAFKGLREDKAPEDVVLEAPVGGAPATTQAAAAAKMKAGGAPEVAGVRLTHPDRILWEDAGVTKQGLAEFYEDIAPWVLPHLVHRPLALVRCPSGAGQGCFFQKHAFAGLSDLVRREMVRDESGEEEVLYIEDLGGLIALVQAGVLEIHPWGSTIGDVERPDRVVIDLDPGEGVDYPTVMAAAREARERLSAFGLESFVKTTGGKGLHVVFPLTPDAGWDEVKTFARDFAEAMERDSPTRYISTSGKRDRTGKIYVDYLRNGRGATAISAFSTRARPGAPVATTLSWDELSPAIKPNHFTVENLPSRLRTLRRDPWADLFTLDQRLPEKKARARSAAGRQRRTRA